MSKQTPQTEPDMSLETNKMSNTRRRVKVYVLNDERQWDDSGTGHVSCMYVDHDKLQGIVLLVRSEDDGSVLQESKIQLETVYQKQQETLIVWSEGGSDLALSFQEKEGCDEIWEKICQVQGKDPSVDITQEIGEEEEDCQYEEVQDFSAPVELPPCELSKLEEIAEIVASVLPSPLRREKLANALEQDKYIINLLELFRVSEDLENIDGLHHLNEIFKALFMLNKNSLFEIMFLEDNIFDVIGVLEYDPNKKDRTPHREFLRQRSHFKEVIPITNKDLLQKIHQTFRVQYIQDILVPVPSVFEDNMSTLGSFIFFNKIEIVNMIQEDERFLTILFTRLTDDELPDDKRKHLVLFLKELCSLSQTLQQHNRDTFLKALSAHGLLPTLETLMNMEDLEMKAAIVDVLCCIAEYSPSMVREYFIKESHKVDDDSLLVNMLIDQMICGGDSSMSVLLLCLLRMLLDPENMGLGTNKMEKSEFLSFFYKHSMHILTAPLFAVTALADRPSKDDFVTASTLDHIIDILSFCVEHHTYHIKNYILNKDLLRRVLVLMKSSHKFVALAALRFCRKIIGIKDEFYNRYITKGKLLEPVIQALTENGERYNLLNSAIIELFEYIRMEDVKSLCSYIVETHMDNLDPINYVQTFQGLKLNNDKEKDRISRNSTEKNSNHGIIHINSSRFKRDVRDMDEDEEIWFDSEEDDLANSPPVDHHLVKTVNAKLKDVDLIDNIPIKRPASNSPPYVNSPPPSPQSATPKRPHVDSPPPKTAPVANMSPVPSSVNTKKLPLGGLVDYPDDDDEEVDINDENLMSPAKKPRIDVTT